jgi:ubiquinone/menaquinone biosynthesis C-methylase UbiE
VPFLVELVQLETQDVPATLVVILPLGKLRAKEEVYEHLFGSIIKFPHREGLIKILSDIGFSKAKYEPVTGGIVYIYRAVK